jgi:TIR domain
MSRNAARGPIMRKPANLSDGNWIFVSHSTLDLVPIHQIRNFLEDRGHNPILFFLRCLNDDDLLPELLRREIEARNFFVLCDSPNARNSDWVQEERRMVMEMPDKVYEEIDLTQDFAQQLPKLEALSKRASVFLSYSSKDRQIALEVANFLKWSDFLVLNLEDHQDSNWGAGNRDLIAESVKDLIAEAVKDGFVLLLLSNNWFTSGWAEREFYTALEAARKSGKSNVVPAIVADRDALLARLEGPLQVLEHFDLTAGDLNSRMRDLVANLKIRDME